jgi:hypothetical protein
MAVGDKELPLTPSIFNAIILQSRHIVKIASLKESITECRSTTVTGDRARLIVPKATPE